MEYNILLVEDTESDVKNCTDTAERMNDENEDVTIVIDCAKTVEEASHKLKCNNYHGVIIDIKIEDGTEKNGNDVITNIVSTYRLPVAVMTGTPGFKSSVGEQIPVYIKGEKKYSDIINELIEIDNTGLFNVLGGKGLIEQKMISIFWNNLYPQLDKWKQYRADGIETEAILLRYTLAHLLEGLSEDGPAYCTEETYISLTGMDDRLHTGDIVINKKGDEAFILLSPPCDLAVHNGKTKTDTIMLCTIEEVQTNIGKDKLTNIIKNKNEFNHWLPNNSMFKGGVVNFRKVITLPIEEFDEQYKSIGIKVQDAFVKNIMNRFSAYYARQGQPDFDFDKEITSRITN